MTTTQELLESSFELNLNNYGPEDVERLNDWAINAYAALEALQAEVKHLNLHLKATQSGRDAALARLSNIERQEPVAEMTLVDMGIGDARQLRVNWLMDGYLDVGAKLYASAGASPVEPNFCESCAMDLSTCDCVTPRPVFVNQLPSAQPSQALSLDLLERLSKTLTRLGYATPEGGMEHFNADLANQLYNLCRAVDSLFDREQPPAPCDAAREYMTGYSDAKEWAKPSQAVELDYEKKLDIVSNWFSDEGMQSRAMQMLGDIEQAIAAAPQPKEPK